MGNGGSAEAKRERRLKVAEAKRSLRDLRIELSVLNHRVGAKVELKDIDFDCLDVIARDGPLSPSALARRVGVHLATMTGILARLEEGGWIVRDRLETDRRAVQVRGIPARLKEVLHLFNGMNTAMDGICARYSDRELDVIVDFLRRTAEAGTAATGALG